MLKSFSLFLVLSLLVSVVLVDLASSQTYCPTAPSSPADRRSDKNTLKIAAYNVEWLFLDGRTCPGTGCPWTTEALAEQHLRDVAGVIQEINADILSLEEVQDCSTLYALIDLLPSNFGYLPYMIKGTDSATGQNVGVLTRVDPSQDFMRTEARADFPIAGTKCGSTTSGDSGISKHYYTIFNINGVRVLFIGMHLIAFPVDAARCNQREAQATVAVELIQSLEGEYDEIVILGDLNDYNGAVVDAAGDLPNSRVLQWLSAPTSDLTLISSAQYLTQNQRYTAWYDIDDNCKDQGGKEHTSIDHLLISPGLVAKLNFSTIDHSYNVSCKTQISDHWPVIVSVDL